MRRRVEIHRQVRIGGGGPVGCLLTLLGAVAIFVLGGLLLWGLLWIALGVAVGLVILAGVLAVYVRLRRWWRRAFGRPEGSAPTYKAEVFEDDHDRLPPPPKERRVVQVRRRPPGR